MAVRIATSDPKPSTKANHHGFLYFYYNKKLPNGGECAALIPQSLQDIVKKGFTFDDNVLAFDTNLKASLLQLDFDEPAVEDPSLPPGEEGWSDHDHLTAAGPADPELLAELAQRTAAIPNRGVRPETVRKQLAEAIPDDQKIPAEFLRRLKWLTIAQRIACSDLRVRETPRALEAQKLVVTAWIDYSKSIGVEYSDAEEKAMRF